MQGDTRTRRNVITLSDMDPDLEDWAKEVAKRTGKPFYQVVNRGLELLRQAREWPEEEEKAAASSSH